jgi:CHAT domain-containing protein
LIFPPLQVAQEVKNIKSAANESNQGIIFKCAVATQTNFVQMLNKCPKMMHISCHGIPNNANTMMENYQQTKNEGDFLLFEHEQLIGELISEKSLRNLITNVWETELVFLAACDSKFAGKIFLKKGVRHVVCIEDRKEVLDKAMITFTNMFYRSVFDGRPICEAFIVA